MDVPFADSTKLDSNNSNAGGGGGVVCDACVTVDDIGGRVEYVGACKETKKLLRYKQATNPNVKPKTKKKN